MKAIKYILLTCLVVVVLIISFLFQIYYVSTETGYQPVQIEVNEEVELFIYARSMSTDSIWLPFYSNIKDYGPYKFQVSVEDLTKKFETLTIVNVVVEEPGSEKITLNLTNKKSEKSTYSKQHDEHYGTEYFSLYTPDNIDLSKNIFVTVEFYLSKGNEKKKYKFKAIMDRITTKHSGWFSIISA